MCLRFQFYIYQRVWVLHFLKKVNLIVPIIHVVDYSLLQVCPSA
jgi:hypothetical protein